MIQLLQHYMVRMVSVKICSKKRLKYQKHIKNEHVKELTDGTAVMIHFLEAGGAGAGEGFVAWQTQMAATSIVGATAVSAT